MTEHEKRIREALEAGPQAWNYDSNMRPFYNDPEGHSRGGEFDGTYTLFGADFEIDGEAYEGPTLSERCKEADAKFIAACNPAAIRALLADLDAVRGDLSAAKDGGWLPIETAPRGSGIDGPDSVTHPDYVDPPKLLLWTEEGPLVGYYDWYYHPGYGRGAEDGESAWRDHSGARTYGASAWQPLPNPPKGEV